MKTQTNTTTHAQVKEPSGLGIKELVDELADIETKLESIDARKLMKDADEIKRKLREHIAMAGYKEDNPVALLGNYAEVEFHPAVRERVVTEKGRLKKYLGGRLYDQLATFSIKELEKHLSKNQIAAVVSEYYGTRRVNNITLLEQPLH